MLFLTTYATLVNESNVKIVTILERKISPSRLLDFANDQIFLKNLSLSSPKCVYHGRKRRLITVKLRTNSKISLRNVKFRHPSNSISPLSLQGFCACSDELPTCSPLNENQQCARAAHWSVTVAFVPELRADTGADKIES